MSIQVSKGLKNYIFCFFGIFLSYLLFGIFQEKIATTRYGDSQVKFRSTYCLILVQCCANSIWSFVVIVFYKKRSLASDGTPWYLYACSAFTYSLAMFASNDALKFVSYPTQVIAKSIKPVPVILFTSIFGGVTYGLRKYLIVMAICSGVFLFMYKGNNSAKDVASGSTTVGQLLLMLSLAMDGVTASFQERIRRYHNTDCYFLMFKTNIFAIMILTTWTSYTGESIKFVEFCYTNPEVIFDLFLFSITSAIGQNFIFYAVANISPLACSIFTTTRKFFTVLISVILYKNYLLPYQWFGIAIVFIGLGSDAVYEKRKVKAT